MTQQNPILLLLYSLIAFFITAPIHFLRDLFFSSAAHTKSSSESAASMTSNRLAPVDLETGDPVYNLNDIDISAQPDTSKYNFPQIPLSTLHAYGAKDSKFLYVGINGYVYDVSHNAENYGPNASYGVFSNKDASRALAMSSLNGKDICDEEGREGSLVGLEDKHYKTLKQWEDYFRKKYRIVAKIELPAGEEGYLEYLKERHSSE